MKFLIIILMFFVLGSLLIISNNNLFIYNSEDVDKFSLFFLDWVNKVFENLKSVTGNVIELDWGPK